MRSTPVPAFFIAAFFVPALAGGCGDGSSVTVNDSQQAVAIAEAKVAFQKAERSGRDLSAGPCVSESLPGLSDWVADIAHNPRQPVDDQPVNQCQSYRDGQTHHFVELTPTGQLIRAQ
jgi:hypothetical protein